MSESLIFKRFSFMKDNFLFCDAIIKVEDQEFHVHKSYMSAFSDILLERFKSESGSPCVIPLNGITAKSVSFVIEYAYTGSIEISTDNLEEILETATQLQMKSVIQKCLQFINTSLNLENVFSYLKMTQIYNLTSDNSTIMSYILKNFEKLMKGDEFLLLSKRTLQNILSNDDLIITKELSLFKALVKWIKNKHSIENKTLREMLEYVRYGLIDDPEKEQIYGDDIMYKQECASLLKLILDLWHKPDKRFLFDDKLFRKRSSKKCVIILSGDHKNSKIKTSLYKLDNKNLNRIDMNFDNIPYTDYFRCCCINNFIYCFSCYQQKCYIHRLDLDTRRWEKLITLEFFLYYNEFINKGKHIFICGGANEYHEGVSSVFSYDIETNECVRQPDLPRPLCSHAGVSVGDSIYLTGGYDGNSYSADVLKLQDDVSTCKTLASMNSTRYAHSITALPEDNATHLYVFGGRTEEKTFSSECYSIKSNQWTIITNDFSSVLYHSSITFGEDVFIFGGIYSHDCIKSDIICRHSLDFKQMTTLKTRLPFPTCCVSSFIVYDDV